MEITIAQGSAILTYNKTHATPILCLSMTIFQLLLCTCPDQDTAQRIAQQLLEQRLAACVNILPGITSMYHWQEQIESASEHLLLIKSTAAHYPEIAQLIQQQHPYEVPELISLPIEQGLPAYLQWLLASVKPTS